MSLINDMLRDLSRQQSVEAPSSSMVMESSAWEKERIADFFQYSRLPVFILSGLVFVIVLALFNFNLRWLEFLPFASKSPLSNSVTSELISVNDSSSTEQSKPINLIPPTIPTESRGDNKSDQLNQRIYELIDKASRAVTLDRLTSPEQDNAFFYYQELLKIDSQNGVAINGINKIVDRYLDMVDRAIEKNQIVKANHFLEKASWVNPQDGRIAEYRDKLSLSSIAAPEVDVVDTQIQKQKVSTSTQIESVSVNDPFEKPAVFNQKNTYLSIEPNIESLDEQAIKTAEILIAAGRKLEAIEGLRNQISQYSSPKSEDYLLDLYYRDNNIQGMQFLLNSHTNLSQVEKTYHQARIKILENDNQMAIQLLESNLSLAEQNENYRALLAGLYQRQQLYLQAISAYRNLLQSFSSKPAYWLGLALSLDAQKQFAAASHAYNQLLHFNDLEPKVQNYARVRIDQLSREN